MKRSHLAQSFDQYFEIVFANTTELQRESYRIRHQVYSEELGWEPPRDSNMEMDAYDEFSHSILLRHKRTGAFVGTVRLVLPPPELPHATLPFEDNCLGSMMLDVIDPAEYERGTFGEVSRVAVLEEFRKRTGEHNRPFSISDECDRQDYSEDEKRHFPNIAVGLYLSILAFARMCNHQLIFVLVEPRFQKRLQQMGLVFERAGQNIEHHGTRALFFLRRRNFIANLTPDVLGLYHFLESQLAKQLILHPYLTKTEHPLVAAHHQRREHGPYSAQTSQRRRIA